MNKIDLLLKIGGSVLTDKSKINVINYQIIDKISSVLKELYDTGVKMCIVTGVGNIGHQIVSKYGINKGDNGSIERRLGLLDAQINVNQLRNIFLNSLLKAGVPAFQLYASSIARSNNKVISSFYLDSCVEFLESNLVPVISGDVVPDTAKGYSVLSGDLIFLEIYKQWSPKLAVYGTNVDGIYTKDPLDPLESGEAKLIHQINSETMHNYIHGVSTGLSEDVSGGMLGKFKAVISLLQLDPKFKTHIINLTFPNNLMKLINNEEFNHTVVEY